MEVITASQKKRRKGWYKDKKRGKTILHSTILKPLCNGHVFMTEKSFLEKKESEGLRQIRSGDTLLGARGEVRSLFHNTLGSVIKAITMAIWASGRALGDDGLTPFAHLIVVGWGYDLLGARRSIGKVQGIWHESILILERS